MTELWGVLILIRSRVELMKNRGLCLFLRGAKSYYQETIRKVLSGSDYIHVSRLVDIGYLLTFAELGARDTQDKELVEKIHHLVCRFCHRIRVSTLINITERRETLYYLDTYLISIIDEAETLSMDNLHGITPSWWTENWSWKGTPISAYEEQDVPSECREHPGCHFSSYLSLEKCEYPSSILCDCKQVSWCGYMHKYFSHHQCTSVTKEKAD